MKYPDDIDIELGRSESEWSVPDDPDDEADDGDEQWEKRKGKAQ